MICNSRLLVRKPEEMLIHELRPRVASTFLDYTQVLVCAILQKVFDSKRSNQHNSFGKVSLRGCLAQRILLYPVAESGVIRYCNHLT